MNSVCNNLPAFVLTNEYIKSIETSLPVLPENLFIRYQQEYGLSNYDAAQLSEDKTTANYFEKVIQHTDLYKIAANWMLGPIRQFLNTQQKDFSDFNLQPILLVELMQLVEAGKVNFSVAAAKILPVLIERNESALRIAEDLKLMQVSDIEELATWIDETLETMPDKVAEYKKGKKGLIGLFVGEVKKRSKGKADPKIVTQLLEEKLK